MNTKSKVQKKTLRLVGKHIVLRIAREDDAEFILKLRLDPALNKFLHETDPSVEAQRAWIKMKQGEDNDYHMIIEDKSGKRLGTVAVYNIKGKTFEWGRWVISKTAPFYAAIESAVLVYDFAFNELLLEKSIFDANNQNKNVVRFHKEFGARVMKEDEKATWFVVEKEDFKKALVKYKRFYDAETK